MQNKFHESVMVEEAVLGLHIENQANYIDATLGTGGHTLEIARRGGRVLGIEMDPKMLVIASERLEMEIENGNCKLVNGNFSDVDKIAKKNDWIPVSGILFDLGVSNLHLKDLERGFSFENPEAPLDMRLNPEYQSIKGADLLNALREDQLKTLFEVTLEPGAAKWVSGRVIHSRERKPIETVGDLLEVCEGLKVGKVGLNEATLPFLAVRIAVNSELDNLREGLGKAYELIEKGGRIVVITFHSGEDAIVKDFFKLKANQGAKRITFKPVRASDGEIAINKKARSAKIRILEK